MEITKPIFIGENLLHVSVEFTLNISLFYRTNPLGMKGHIAQCYGDLIKDMWSGSSKTTAPLKLRVSAENAVLTLSQTTNFRLFQTERVCR